MKKILIFALTSIMLLSFCACASDVDEDDVRGTKIENSDSDKNVDDETKEEDPVETQATVAPTAMDDSSENEFALGTTSGLIYENEFIGIGCTLPSGWTFYTDEQIKELNNITTDMAGEEIAELIKNSNVVYDMLAVNSNQMDTINVVFEKVDMDLDITEYIDLGLPAAKTALENMGGTNITTNIGTLTIDGKEFTSVDIECDFQGIKLYQTQFYTKRDKYVVAITAGTYYENKLADILDGFYLI